MKKFLSKLPTMIVFLVLAVTMLTITLVNAFKPVTYGDEYSMHIKTNSFSNGFEYMGEVTTTFHFEDDNTIAVRYATETDHAVFNFKIARNGHKFVILGDGLDVSDKDIKDAQKDLSKLYSTHTYGRVTGYSLHLENTSQLYSLLVTHLSIDSDQDLYDTLTSYDSTTGDVIWAFNSLFTPRIVIDSLISVIFITMATISTICFIKKKKS